MSRDRDGAKSVLLALALGPGLLFLTAYMDQREEAMQVNLNAPAIEQGPLTADEMAAYSRDRLAVAWADPDALPCPQFASGAPMAAEPCTDMGANPQGNHRDGWLSRMWLRLLRALA